MGLNVSEILSHYESFLRLWIIMEPVLSLTSVIYGAMIPTSNLPWRHRIFHLLFDYPALWYFFWAKLWICLALWHENDHIVWNAQKQRKHQLSLSLKDELILKYCQCSPMETNLPAYFSKILQLPTKYLSNLLFHPKLHVSILHGACLEIFFHLEKKIQIDTEVVYCFVESNTFLKVVKRCGYYFQLPVWGCHGN